MARTKSAYRQFKDGGVVLPETPPELSVAIDTDVTPKEMADDPSSALLKQIDALRQSEQAAKDRLAQAAAIPHSRAETIARWQQAGMTAKQAAFLNNNPEMVDEPNMLEIATRAAHLAGHAADTDDFFSAVSSHFNKYSRPDDASKAEDIAEPVEAKINRYSEPSEASSPRANSASMFSAPVSRETQANGSYNSYGDRPGRVTLSVAQKEAARFAGISEVDYAKGVLELRERKANGDYS
jgi:hypothetical protein